MKCTNCGYILSLDWYVCPICSKPINNKFAQDAEDIQKHDEVEPKNNSVKAVKSSDTERIYIIVFIISFTLPILISLIATLSIRLSGNNPGFNLSGIGAICYLVALITIVTGYIKFPKNKVIKFLFWLYTVIIISVIIALVIVALVCAHVASIFVTGCFETCFGCAS